MSKNDAIEVVKVNGLFGTLNRISSLKKYIRTKGRFCFHCVGPWCVTFGVEWSNIEDALVASCNLDIHVQWDKKDVCPHFFLRNKSLCLLIRTTERKHSSIQGSRPLPTGTGELIHRSASIQGSWPLPHREFILAHWSKYSFHHYIFFQNVKNS